MSTVPPTFYFINSMGTISSKTEKTNWQKSMATFLANEINATERDITGQKAYVQIIFPLKDPLEDNIMEGIIFKGIFSGT